MRLLLLILSVMAAAPVSAQRAMPVLEPGDIVFQKLPCGGLCDAIIATTPCTASERFNHCGIVRRVGDSLFVIEAIGSAVQQTPLHRFLARDTSQVLTYGRTNLPDLRRWASAATAAAYVGVPYDDAFLPGDSALYCSELVYRSFYNDLQKRPVFSLQPMTFKPSPSSATHPAWIKYYDDIHSAIPEGLPGINPCAIAADPAVKLYRVPKARF